MEFKILGIFNDAELTASEAAKELKLEASTFPEFPMSPLVHYF